MKDKILKAYSNPFLRSSGIITAVNLLNAACNYLLLIVVSNVIAPELSRWTALNGIMTILSAPIIAINLDVSKSVSRLMKTSGVQGQAYYDFVKSVYFRIGLILVGLTLGLSLIPLFFGNLQDQVILWVLVLWTVFSNLQSGTNTQFLIGVFKTPQSAIAASFNGFGRFMISILTIALGGGVLALPIGTLGGFLGSMWIARYFIRKHGRELSEQHPEETTAKFAFDFQKELLSVAKTVIALTLLSIIMYSTAIITDNLFPKGQRDLYATIFNLGQITFFAATAFMSVFMAHSARSKNWGIYLQSLGIVSFITAAATLTFWVLGPLVLAIFKRSEYTSAIPQILYYMLFIELYGIVFVSVQYLLSKNLLKRVWLLGAYVAVLILALFVVAGSSLIDQTQLIFVFNSVASVFMGLLALVLFLQIRSQNHLGHDHAH